MNANITLLEEYIVDDASFVYVCMSLRNKCVHIYKYVLYNENYKSIAFSRRYSNLHEGTAVLSLCFCDLHNAIL